MKILTSDIYERVMPEEYKNNAIFFSEKEFHELKETMEEVTILMTLPGYVNKRVLDCLPNLKWVQITAAGYDHADVEELKRRALPVTNTSGVMSISIAEDIFCKMLLLARRVQEFERIKAKKEWSSFGQHPWMSSIHTDLFGKTVGILGDGAIAREFATRAKAFGMHTMAYGRSEKEIPCFDRHLTGKNGLTAIAENSDFIVIAIPYNESTYHLLGAEFFAQMKPSTYLINVARGAILDEKILIDALKDRKIAGAALDVFETEPLPTENPLWELPNVYITTHKAGAGDSWIQFLGDLFAHNIGAFLNQEPLKNRII